MAHFNCDRGLVGVGIFLPLERSKMSLAVLVDVIDHPCLALCSVWISPGSTTNRHDNLLTFTNTRKHGCATTMQQLAIFLAESMPRNGIIIRVSGVQIPPPLPSFSMS